MTSRTRLVGAVVNLGLRASMVGMTAAVVRAGPNDPRYRGKGIGSRMALVGLPSTLAIPALWLRWRGPYPVWMDNLYLSIVALDLAGNVFDLYDGYTHFDLIPHAHGGGAVTILAGWLLDVPMLSAIGVAQVGHILLEAQEYGSDVYLGTRNVRGTWDVFGDLLAGVVGSVAYAALYRSLIRGPGREPPSLLRG
jgi:hypothetical protein